MAGKPLAEVVEAGWAQALAPVAQRVADMGDFLRAEIAAGRALPAGRRERAARVHPAVRRRAGADRRPGPVPDAGPPGRAVVLGRARRPAAAAVACRTSSASTAADLGMPTPVDRRPHAVGRARRAAAQQGAHRRAGRAGRRTAARAGRRSPSRRSARSSAGTASRSWRSSGAATRRRCAPLLGDVPLIESAHPSPMSADRGFFGSRPFSRANALLEELGGEPVDWKLP